MARGLTQLAEMATTSALQEAADDGFWLYVIMEARQMGTGRSFFFETEVMSDKDASNQWSVCLGHLVIGEGLRTIDDEEKNCGCVVGSRLLRMRVRVMVALFPSLC